MFGDLLRRFAYCHHNKVAFSVIFGFRRHIMMWLVPDKEAFEEKAWRAHHHYHPPPEGRSFDTALPSNGLSGDLVQCAVYLVLISSTLLARMPLLWCAIHEG